MTGQGGIGAAGWPALDFAADGHTYTTCHLVLQLIGKLPLRLHPWENHGWHVALRVVPHGYATRTIPGDNGPGDNGPGGKGRHFSVELDVREAVIRVACENGSTWQAPVPGRTMAELHGDLTRILGEAGLPAPLHGAPNEMADAIPFVRDHRPRSWDADAACRLHGAFLAADRAFARFRSLYLGKSSPSHLFWGSFDLAVTRFSGRSAPAHPGGIPNLPDTVTREAYSHEVISAGFWPGNPLPDGGVQEAAFYAYAYPTPAGLAEARVEPAAAAWNAALGEFVLPYAAVVGSADPEATLGAFLQSTYDAAARLLDWPAGLTRRDATYGTPPADLQTP